MMKINKIHIYFSLILLLSWFYESEAIQCYNCSTYHDGDACNDVNIKTNKSEKFIIDCPLWGEMSFKNVTEPGNNETSSLIEPILCRKLRQTINGELRITRSCGYIPDKQNNQDKKKKNKDCFKEAYTSFSSSIYCSCKTDLCNSTNKLRIDNIFTSIFVFYVMKFFVM